MGSNRFEFEYILKNIVIFSLLNDQILLDPKAIHLEEVVFVFTNRRNALFIHFFI